MSVILRNDHGAIAVNKGVLERMIIGDLLEMSDTVLLCNKKGKIIKEKSSKLIDPDYFDALEVQEKRQDVKVKIFVITMFGINITDIADEIFSRVENDFEMLRLKKPGKISLHVRGVMSDQLVKRSIEVVRKNV
ncbi:MAG: Asp23/Gls24 family envelope stress response protein [Mogibacterium sp.]|nr:Asp23/Gls24 family envelope stress response protein [Mogibacterium sp.]